VIAIDGNLKMTLKQIVDNLRLNLGVDVNEKVARRAKASRHTKNFGLAATKSFGALAAAETNDEYRTDFDKLPREHPRAAEYIMKIDPRLWTTPYLKGKCYGQTTSNLVEGTNGHIRRERELPIIELLNTL
jgi:hypothetical protein